MFARVCSVITYIHIDEQMEGRMDGQMDRQTDRHR